MQKSHDEWRGYQLTYSSSNQVDAMELLFYKDQMTRWMQIELMSNVIIYLS